MSQEALNFLEPILVPICFVLAWGLVLMVAWTVFSAWQATLNRARQMHLIPCANCKYFTNNYRLKCPVHPVTANTEKAVHCADYQGL